MLTQTPSGASPIEVLSHVERGTGRPSEQRAQLAADVHDGPLQLLMVAAQDLAEADAPTRARGRQLLTQATRDLRALLEPGAEQRPAGWWDARGLEDWCALAAARRPFAWEVRVSGDVGPHRLAFAAARELVTNAARHSGCSHLEVELRADADATRVVVHDDGDGFAPDAQPGFGLQSLRRRVAIVGGTLAFDAAASGGLRATVRLPRAAHAA